MQSYAAGDAATGNANIFHLPSLILFGIIKHSRIPKFYFFKSKSILFSFGHFVFLFQHVYAHNYKHLICLRRPAGLCLSWAPWIFIHPDPNWVQTGETFFHPERSWKDRETTQQHQTRWCTHRFNYANCQGFFLCGLGHFFTNNTYLPVLYYLNNVDGDVFIG